METYGVAHERYVVSMRELLGLIGAHEWRRKGIEIPAAGGRIHPHYGVFAPIRSEYVDLVSAGFDGCFGDGGYSLPSSTREEAA